MTSQLDTRLSAALDACAAELDAEDPLAGYRPLFVHSDGVRSYLDGNSLGRPLRVTKERMASFIDEAWGARLIRSWGESWMDAPTELGDLIGRVVIGAGPGQTVVADSTTVMLYKLLRAAVAARPDRNQVVIDSENFPTDRFVVEGVAAECGLEIRWLSPAPEAGVSLADVEAAIGPRTAVVVLSHIAYRSGYLADLPAITAAAHRAGALVLWDLCHSAGSVEVALDDAEVDLAVGCTYKYLNGGPGAPAFGYVATRLQSLLNQPIQGWMGASNPFAMADRYEPASGIRRFISGTPPIVGMLPIWDMLALIEQAGMPAIRAKSLRLTEFALNVADDLLGPLGARLASPRDAARRGSHITLDHPEFERVTTDLWKEGVVPDFRPPHGLRIGLSPLSTSFVEVAEGLVTVAKSLPRAVG